MSTTVLLTPTTLEDLDSVLAMEQSEENAPFIRQWSREKHAQSLGSASIGHYQARLGDVRIGYVVLTGLDNPDRSIQLKRLVVDRKGEGLGRETLRQTKALVFEQLGAHRLWLEVIVGNERAHSLYLSEGFVEEGVHRESLLQDGRFLDLIVMSILAKEASSTLPPEPSLRH